jgi:hypothetical protein
MAKKPKYGSGERFAALKAKIKAQYKKKGLSDEEAEKRAAGAAANAGRAAHGKKSMAKVAAKGRKRAK